VAPEIFYLCGFQHQVRTDAGALTSRAEEIKKTDVEVKLLDKEIAEEAQQDSSESNEEVEQLKIKLNELKRRSRGMKGQAEAAANLETRMQREKDLQIKEARPRPPPRTASSPLHHIVFKLLISCGRCRRS